MGPDRYTYIYIYIYLFIDTIFAVTYLIRTIYIYLNIYIYLDVWVKLFGELNFYIVPSVPNKEKT